jgi:hypothetical protein
MAKKDDKSAEKTNDKEKGKDKGKDKKGKGKVDSKSGPSVAAHPRARQQVRRAKGWGGLAGFGLAAYLSHKAGIPFSQLGFRALVAGVAGYLLAWACAVTVWRHLVLAELRAAHEQTVAHVSESHFMVGGGGGDGKKDAGPAPDAAKAAS